MTDLNSTKFKHLTLDDRIEIQMCLDRGVTFKAIAARVGKDQTTISKEVKRHIKVNPNSAKKFEAWQSHREYLPASCQGPRLYATPAGNGTLSSEPVI